VAWNSWDQACSHGQCCGRCIRRRRAERASRAGMLISWARMVPVVALAWKAEARQPAARVRLNAIAASTSQALFAANEPDVIFRRRSGQRVDLRVCLVDGVVDAALPSLLSAWADGLGALLPGRVAAGRLACGLGCACRAEGFG